MVSDDPVTGAAASPKCSFESHAIRKSAHKMMDVPLSESAKQNSLDFSKVEVYGRDKEVASLMDSYKKIFQKDCPSKMVLLRGYSGTGKSSLVFTLRETFMIKGYFASGKFDQICRDYREFSGVAAMFCELCDHIFLNHRDLEIVRRRLHENLSQEYATALANIVPNIRNILDQEIPHRDHRPICIKHDWAFDKIKFACRKFLQAVCSRDRPVVLFMDDLQWADSASLELIRNITEDEGIEGILFIAAYRDKEVEDPQLVNFQCEVTQIALSNLELRYTNLMISILTELDPSETMPLATLVQHKTDGNAFYSIQFLKLLEEKQLLRFSTTTSKWNWDIEGIMSETDVTDNVVDLVASKIQRLPQHTRNALVSAACIGHQVETDVLASIVEDCYGNTIQEVLAALEFAADEGIIVKRRRIDAYRFAHDRVRQAAYSLLPEGKERDSVHWKIGSFLKNVHAANMGDEWMLLMATDQLNSGSGLISHDEEKIELATLNLSSAEFARSRSSFFRASRYLQKGVALIPGPSKWKTHYDLHLRLSTALAEMEYCIGNIRECQHIADEVLNHALELDDRLPVYFIVVEALAQGETFDEVEHAVMFGLNVLRELGIPVPKSPHKITTASDFLKVKCKILGFDDAKFLDLPEMKDEHKLAAMRMMTVLIYFCWFHGRKECMALLILKMMGITIQSGLSKYAPNAFVYYGMLLAIMGNFDEAFRFSQLASNLSQKFQAKDCDVQRIVIAKSMVDHLKRPLKNGLDDSLLAHQAGLESGEIRWAAAARVTYVISYFYSGFPLESLSNDMEDFESEIRSFQMIVSWHTMQLYRQAVDNLLGRNEDPLLLSGSVMDEEEFIVAATEANNIRAIQHMMLLRFVLTVFFDDLDQSWLVMKEMQRTGVKIEGTSIWVSVVNCFIAFVQIDRAKKTGKKWPLRSVHLIIKNLEGWGLNAQDKVLLLKAELLAMKNASSDVVKKAFDVAIERATASFVSFAALICERAGLFCLDRGLQDWAAHYIGRSISLYNEWGAFAKVRQMKDDHEWMIACTQHEKFSANSASSVSGTEMSSASERKLEPQTKSKACWTRTHYTDSNVVT